jgi:mono/diheme cytochrome c family protein
VLKQENTTNIRRVNVREKRFIIAGWIFGALALLAGSGAIAAEGPAGKVIFDKQCASCHGADGKGNPDIAKALGDKGLNLVTKETTQKSDAQLLKTITEGAGKMPPAKGLSKDDEKAIVSYTRSLAKLK